MKYVNFWYILDKNGLKNSKKSRKNKNKLCISNPLIARSSKHTFISYTDVSFDYFGLEAKFTAGATLCAGNIRYLLATQSLAATIDDVKISTTCLNRLLLICTEHCKVVCVLQLFLHFQDTFLKANLD